MSAFSLHGRKQFIRLRKCSTFCSILALNLQDECLGDLGRLTNNLKLFKLSLNNTARRLHRINPISIVEHSCGGTTLLGTFIAVLDHTQK